MLNNKQRKIILYGSGLVCVLVFLAIFIYVCTQIEYDSGKIWETVLTFIAAYGGIAFLIAKIIFFIIMSTKKVKTSKAPNIQVDTNTPKQEVQSVVVKQVASKSVLKNKIGNFNNFDIYMEDNKVLFVSTVPRDKFAYISDMVNASNDLVNALKQKKD